MRLSPGKRKRLEAVSDSRGVIGALAIDQRDALRSLFSAESKIEKSLVPRERLEEFKSIVVRALSPHASAVLLEPEYGLHAAAQRAAGTRYQWQRIGRASSPSAGCRRGTDSGLATQRSRRAHHLLS